MLCHQGGRGSPSECGHPVLLWVPCAWSFLRQGLLGLSGQRTIFIVSSSRTGERSCCRKWQQECESLPQLRVALTTGAVLSVLLLYWRGAFVAPGSFSHHPCTVGWLWLHSQLQAHPLGVPTSPRVCPAQPQVPEGPSWELKDRSWGQQGGEAGNPSCQELPAHRQERLCHTFSTCVSPALPCWGHGAVQAELDWPLWLRGSGHPFPGAGNAGERGNERSWEGMEEQGGKERSREGMKEQGGEDRSWEGMEEQGRKERSREGRRPQLLPCRFADCCSLVQLGFACADNLVILS